MSPRNSASGWILVAIAMGLALTSCHSSGRSPRADVDVSVSGDVDTTPPPDTADPDLGLDLDATELVDLTEPEPWTTLDIGVEVLGTGETRQDFNTYAWWNLKLTDPDTGHVAYVLWVGPEPNDGAALPAMLTSKPYAGIAWSDDPVDMRWATLPEGIHPDVDGPSYDPDTSGDLSYRLQPPDEAVAEARVWLFNRIRTLFVYSRFYAGGGPRDDVADVTLGMRFLAEHPNVTNDRIGVIGASWGGMLALQAAANAPSGAAPRLGVALFAMSDLAEEMAWIASLDALDEPARTTYAQALDPYVRRIVADTGGAPDAPDADYDGLVHDDLLARLETPFVVLHSSHDTLAPFTMSEALVADAEAAGRSMRTVWLEEAVDADPASLSPDHHVSVPGLSVLWSALMTRSLIVEGSIVLPADRAGLIALLDRLDEQRGRGQSLQDAPRLLTNLADERIAVVDTGTGQTLAGAEYLTEAVNASWGTAFTPETIAAELEAVAEP